MYTDNFQKKISATEKWQPSSATLHPQELIFAAGQFQKSPLRPPFLKGGWGDFRELWPKEHLLYKI
jgi:hypothetical protein